MSRQLCKHHPDVDYKIAWGCPDCIVELRKQSNKLAAACHLVLLFHDGEQWTDDKRNFWNLTMTYLLGPVADRDPKVVGAHGDGTWDGAKPTNEATTKNLCNAIRAALTEYSNNQRDS
jgi:hypothetical protein